MAAKPRKILLVGEPSRSVQLGHFSDDRWASIASALPTSLAAEADASLRSGVTGCCSWLLTQNARLQEGVHTAAAIRRAGRGQAPPLERLAKHLKSAADAWAEIDKMHDDRRGILSDLAPQIAAMAKDAERRLRIIRSDGRVADATSPFPAFVRRIAQCCRAVGLEPAATGRVYDEKNGSPTWFQSFIVAIDNRLLGHRALIDHDAAGREIRRDARATYALIAKALRGDAKPRKSRR